jgi:hypothetical protein
LEDPLEEQLLMLLMLLVMDDFRDPSELGELGGDGLKKNKIYI